MVPPRKITHRPRITLGQVLVSVAISAVPMAFVLQAGRRTDQLGEAVVTLLVCLVMTLLTEIFFWGMLVPIIPALERALGRPSWFRSEIDVDPLGITWVDERPNPVPHGAPEDEIHWLE